MLNDSDSEKVKSTLQFNADKEHYEAMCTAVQIGEYTLFSMLRPTVTRDGNQWCVLYGDDLMTGVAGFGDTPYLAVLDFNKSWHINLNK